MLLLYFCFKSVLQSRVVGVRHGVVPSCLFPFRPLVSQIKLDLVCPGSALAKRVLLTGIAKKMYRHNELTKRATRERRRENAKESWLALMAKR